MNRLARLLAPAIALLPLVAAPAPGSAQETPALTYRDAAMQRQDKEPPPLPDKDLSFADGWTFRARGNSCTATRALATGVTIDIGFSNFGDGTIRLTGKSLPPIDDSNAAAQEARHSKGAGPGEDAAGNYADALDPGVTYANFPGTAIFVDGVLAARFVTGFTEDGVTTLRLGHLQDQIWPHLKTGKDLAIKLVGQEKYRLSLDASPALWAEMQQCIDQYPEG